MDPPASGVKATIARLRAAGLRTIMLTGDQRSTAAAIGRELGLVSTDDQVIDGREMQALSPDALQARVARAAAFSRIAPEEKLRVVRSLPLDAREWLVVVGLAIVPAIIGQAVKVWRHRSTPVDISRDERAA
jgi:hypothetical protein